MRHGGPAFPRPAGWNGLSNHEEHSSNEPQDGMTLRDYFAAAALQGFLGGPGMEVVTQAAKEEGFDEQTFIVRTAYQMADAMLAERDKR